MTHRLSEPAEGVNDVAVDHHFEVEVAAGGGAGGAAHRNDVAAGDLLADLDGGRGQVVVGGLQAVAVVDHHPVSAAVRVPSVEGHGAAGCRMDGGSALGR